jgi:hypothetical protein
MTDLEMAYAALSGKQARYNTLWRYYDGDHPLEFSYERLKEVFGDKAVNFSENWCAVVVDSQLDRINLEQLSVSNDQAASDRMADIMAETELQLDADDAHRAALVCGESFVVVEQTNDDKLMAYYNDPRLCHMFYQDVNPRQKRLAAKWWTGSDRHYYMTLYYPDHFEYYRSRGNAETTTSAAAFVPVDGTVDGGGNWPANEWNVIPVFHFRRERRRAQSVLANVIGPQAAYNKLFSDMMVAAEYGAFKQRWIISNADVSQLKNSPNEVWDLPGGDGQGQQTTVGEFSATELGNYNTSMEKIAQDIARITRLPRHYFSQQGGDPSGEALIAMEAPLNKQVGKFISNAAVTWRKLAAFLMELDGVAVKPSDIEVTFAPVETVQPRTQAEIRQINTQAGLPLRTSLRWEGRTPQEIEQVEQEQVDEQAQSANLATAYLAVAERKASQQGMAQAQNAQVAQDAPMEDAA